MLDINQLLAERYRITYLLDERPGCTLYRALDTRTNSPHESDDQHAARSVLIAECPHDDAADDSAAAALEHTRTLAAATATSESDGLLPATDTFNEGQTFYLVLDDPAARGYDRTLNTVPDPAGVPSEHLIARIEPLLDACMVLHRHSTPLLMGELQATDLWLNADGTTYLAPYTLIRPLGTVESPYRAPELEDEHATPTVQSDLYALAAVCYHLLTGWPPPVARRRLDAVPLNPPHTLNSAISPLLEQVLLKALDISPDQRHASVAEFQRAVQIARLLGQRAAPARAAPAPTSEQQPSLLPPFGAAPVAPPVADAALTTAPPPTSPQAGLLQEDEHEPAEPAEPDTDRTTEPDTAVVLAQNNTCLLSFTAALVVMLVLICGLGVFFFAGSGLNMLVAEPQADTQQAAGVTATPIPTATPVPAPTAAPQPTATPRLPDAVPNPANPPGPVLAPDNIDAIGELGRLNEVVMGMTLYSPDGTLLAVATNNVIRLYDTTDLTLVRELTGHEGNISALTFLSVPPAAAPNSTEGDDEASTETLLLASGAVEEDAIRLWDVATGQQTAFLQGHTGWIRSLSAAPDGLTLASGSTDQTIRLWNVPTISATLVITGHTDWLGNIDFSPDGTRLASASRDGTVRLWDVATGTEQTARFTAPVDPESGVPYWTTGLDFSPDGQTIAVGATDTTVRLLDAQDMSVLNELDEHDNWIVIQGVAFSPDGQTLASAALDGTVRLWEVDSGDLSDTLQHSGDDVVSLAWHPDGSLLAASSNDSDDVLVWQVDGRLTQELPLGPRVITSLDYSTDGRTLGLGAMNGSVRLLERTTGRATGLVGAVSTSQSLAFLDADTVAIATANLTGSIALVNLERPREPLQLEGLGTQATRVAASPDGSLVAAGSTAGEIVIWDAGTGEIINQFQAFNSSIAALVFSPDGQQIIASNTPGAPAAAEDAGGENGDDSDDPPDLTPGNGGSTEPTVGIWDARSADLLHSLTDAESNIIGLAVVVGETLLAGVSADALSLWDIETGIEIRVSQLDRGDFTSVAASPDGTLLAAGTDTGQVVFWEPRTGRRVHTLTVDEESAVQTLTFHPNSEEVIVALADGSVRVFGLP